MKGRGFQNPGMNSFNHWAFGAVGEWIWRHVAGINPDDSAPGFREFTIRPRPGGGVSWAHGSYDSIRGRIATNWKIGDGAFSLQVTIPANTTATVYVPATEADSVREGGKKAAEAAGVALLKCEDGSAVFRVGSGTYAFTAPLQ